jgi:hypothetical protein
MKFLKKAVQGVGKAVKGAFGGSRMKSVSPGGRGAFAGAVARAIKDAPVSSAGGTAGTAGKASDVAEKAMPVVQKAASVAGMKKGGAVSKRSSSSTSARGQGAVMKKKRAPKMC